MPPATARSAMSRSMTIPVSVRRVTTGIAPTVRGLRVMMSGSLEPLPNPNWRPSRLPSPPRDTRSRLSRSGTPVQPSTMYSIRYYMPRSGTPPDRVTLPPATSTVTSDGSMPWSPAGRSQTQPCPSPSVGESFGSDRIAVSPGPHRSAVRTDRLQAWRLPCPDRAAPPARPRMSGTLPDASPSGGASGAACAPKHRCDGATAIPVALCKAARARSCWSDTSVTRPWRSIFSP